jgi:D-alanyl-D-alanine carboxypeptidase (penicillin-binding protein 5/6)
MKIKRILSVFLCAVLITSLFLMPAAQAVADPNIAAKAALLVEDENGAVLYDKNAHAKEYPASITKVMTALLVLEAVDRGDLSLSTPVTASATALSNLDVDGSSAGVVEGETMTVEELLYCMLLVSANETCNILAEAVAGSVSAFVDMMNARAAELGCNDTHFANTNGLHNADHYTSAWDIYLFAKQAMTHDTFRTICNSKSYFVPATNLSGERELHTTNYLISNWRATGYLYDDAFGIKTGSTDEAGHCLVSSAIRNGRTLYSVVLGADETEVNGETVVGSFTETSRLFDWGFDNFSSQIVLDENDAVAQIPVALSKEVNYVSLRPQQTTSAVLPVDLDPSLLEKTVTFTSDTAYAPITAGDVLGQVTLSYNGVTYATVPLVALNDVSASSFLRARHAISVFFSRTIVRVVLIAIVVLAIAIFVLVKFFRRNRRYGSRKSARHRSYRGRRR